MTNHQDFFFSEFWTHYLETDRERERCVVGWCSVASGDRESRDTSESARDGEDVCHVVGERVIVHLTDFPCDHRGDRSGEDIDFLKCFGEFFSHEFSDERRAVVVGIVKS